MLVAAVLVLTAYAGRGYWLPDPVDLCFSGQADKALSEAIPREIGNMDVIFAFDQSGSMGGMIDGAKAEATTLMKSLRARWGTERFAVAGFSDYVDFPYRLYQPLSKDIDVVQAAINGLTLADGGDLPEAYGRMMYESYADPSIEWQEKGRRYLIIFGDSYPHDPDAGRDGELGTPDDLSLDDVLSKLAANGIILIYVADPGVAGNEEILSQWDDWATTIDGNIIRCRKP